jgi:excisionase family DNA binding protein
MSEVSVAGLPTGTYDTGDVATLLKSSSRHVRRLADGGKMPPPLRIGRLIRWPKATIDDWLANGAKPVRTFTSKGARP